MSNTPAVALVTLVTRVMVAPSFEDAAITTLRTMLDCAAQSLAESTVIKDARPLRAWVHLRMDDGYQRIFGIDHSTSAEVEGTAYLASTKLWQWVTEHRSSVSIELLLGETVAHRPHNRTESIESDQKLRVFGADTYERMLTRDVSHVHVVPLRTPGGGVSGMITIEAQGKRATGRPAIWDGCYETLGLLASIAAPYLITLPPRAAPKVTTDDLLPVVGRTTAGLVELLRVFAEQEETVLISGPTGAGKSRLARWCHEQSSRKKKRFETLDLMSTPDELQMAELFGWKRGAFTGAVKDSVGAIGRAADGTLFIDEIDKLSLKTQAGLLRVLEEGTYRPLGDEGAERQANVRFIVGTNADLRASVRAKKFREDLYYRINVLPARLPPLSERLDELPLWAEYMVTRRHREAERSGTARLERDGVELLLKSPWPGNLRQLDNIIRRAYALALLNHRGATGDVVIEMRHLKSALEYDGVIEETAIINQLWRAALAFVREAELRQDSGNSMKLEMIEAMRGLVLAAAVARRGGRDEAFTLLGQQHLVKNRNYHRTYRREIERVQELVKTLGGDVDESLAVVLNALDEPD